ncbi:hypothetical protein [Treponema sp.]|uniref:hypothetical protein n=1 Tax=Treponema sp. TaxID=166 RepID=UPI00388E4766
MKKTLLSLVFAFFSLGAAFAWYGEDAQKNYDVAERLFDEKRYKEAIEEYLKVVEETESLYELKDSDKRDIASESLLKFDGIGEAKILYYSLYNIACCHSLIENFAESKKYLIAALHAGYPSLNYILNDSDMRPFFSSARSLKSEITEIYNLGNSKSLVQGKKFKRWVVNDCDAYSFNGDTVIQYYDTSDWLDRKLKGTYEVKNYHILMHFYKVSYRKPDPWASAARRRQRVLDYIAKVGKNAPTVFIVLEGTKKLVSGEDMDISD